MNRPPVSETKPFAKITCTDSIPQDTSGIYKDFALEQLMTRLESAETSKITARAAVCGRSHFSPYFLRDRVQQMGFRCRDRSKLILHQHMEPG